jgi:hypothetical protein
MPSTTRHIDIRATRLPREGRWFGIRLVSAQEGSIGFGMAQIAYSLGAYTPPVPADRVEPWLSSAE